MTQNDCESCGKCKDLKEKDLTQCERLYTILVYSENVPGLLSQITAVCTRRQVNIETLNVCASSTPGVHKYTITCKCTEYTVKMLTKQMEKKIDVLQANYYTDDELFMLESALLKISTPVMLSNPDVSHIVRMHAGSFVEVNPVFATLEKTGRSETIMSLYNKLNELGAVLQFVRSGRICVTRSTEERLDNYLARREEERKANK